MNGSTAAARVVLGTVQFGLAYGVANTYGQVTQEEGRAILSSAWSAGVHTLDTAVLYGTSEAALGEIGIRDWDVITKLPEMPAYADVDAWVDDQVGGSRRRLGVPMLEGLLLHRPAQLQGPQGQALYRALIGQQERGRVHRIGVSVYGPDELDALPASMKFDIVQAPWSVFDQRMTRSGWVDRLRAQGCEFHARSVFLQGLLLMPASARPARFQRWNALLQAWDRWLANHDVSPLQACLQHALHAPGISRIVVGVDSAAQLREILAVATSSQQPQPLAAELRTDDPTLLNPALWITA